jgi:hypothetical protein
MTPFKHLLHVVSLPHYQWFSESKMIRHFAFVPPITAFTGTTIFVGHFFYSCLDRPHLSKGSTAYYTSMPQLEYVPIMLPKNEIKFIEMIQDSPVQRSFVAF